MKEKHRFISGKGLMRGWSSLVLGAMFLASPIIAIPKKLSVVTTTANLAHLARRIGGPYVQVRSLLPADADPHYQDARPDYILAVHKADLFVQVGLDLEIGWAPVLLRQARNPRIQPGKPGYCLASQGIHVLQRPTTRVTRKNGDVHPNGNPHYLLDPVNAALAARNIGKALSTLDPIHADTYRKNYKKFAKSMKGLLGRKQNHLRGLRVAVFHSEFVYFSHRFGIIEAASIEEIPGVPPSAAYLKQVSQKLKREGVKIILIASFNKRSYADAVARRTGGKVVLLPVAVGRESYRNTYEKLIETMLDRIQKAAQQDKQ